MNVSHIIAEKGLKQPFLFAVSYFNKLLFISIWANVPAHEYFEQFRTQSKTNADFHLGNATFPFSLHWYSSRSAHGKAARWL